MDENENYDNTILKVIEIRKKKENYSNTLTKVIEIRKKIFNSKSEVIKIMRILNEPSDFYTYKSFQKKIESINSNINNMYILFTKTIEPYLNDKIKNLDNLINETKNQINKI